MLRLGVPDLLALAASDTGPTLPMALTAEVPLSAAREPSDSYTDCTKVYCKALVLYSLPLASVVLDDLSRTTDYVDVLTHCTRSLKIQLPLKRSA
jgi:hypothetical protein